MFYSRWFIVHPTANLFANFHDCLNILNGVYLWAIFRFILFAYFQLKYVWIYDMRKLINIIISVSAGGISDIYTQTKISSFLENMLFYPGISIKNIHLIINNIFMSSYMNRFSFIFLGYSNWKPLYIKNIYNISKFADRSKATMMGIIISYLLLRIH